MEAAKVILDKINKDVKDGVYDEHISIPFMSRELILKSITGKIQRKVESGATPILNKAEIETCIKDAKEAAATAFHLYKTFGFIKENEDGGYEITKKGKLAIKQSQLM